MSAHVSAAPADFIDPLRTSLRENRMVLERLVQWKGVEPGMIFSVMDCAVYALALGILRHDDVERHLDLLAEPETPLSARETDDRLVVDAGGRHAWLVAEAVVDLAIAAYRQGGAGVAVDNVAEPEQLAVVGAIAEKHHLAAGLEASADGRWSVVIGHGDPARQSVLDGIRRRGIRADHRRWFELLALSSNALATDTPVSRTHTGSFIVLPDGEVIGRRDNEYAYEDVSMLTAEKLEFRR